MIGMANMQPSQAVPDHEPFITTREAAAYLGKPVSWLYHEAEERGLPRYKVGNQWRHKRSELDAWVRAGGAR